MATMQTFFAEYLVLLKRCHDDIVQAVEGLPSAALDWTPGREMNSIGVLMTHIIGSERYMIGDIAALESSNRDREAEFQVHGLELDALKQRLTDNLEYARTVVEKMSLQDLESKRVLPSGREYTVAWALLHGLEHATLHLGQIQLTRQLWEHANVSE
jgi:uncharacterized damage-inducible protein DinB